MIRLVYGLPGTGKTKYVSERIREDVAVGKRVILIVPEQQTVEAERNMLMLLTPSAQLSFEVLNFSRLANKLFREFGGLSYNYITNGMKNLFMKRTLIELTPVLSEYTLRAVGDSSLPSLMLSQINEFKINGISATKLERVSESLEDGHPLKAKLADFSCIYSAYEGMVKSAYDDSADDLIKLYENILCKHNFFTGYNVYIDSFSSFTACEHKIIEKIFDQADNTTVTVACGKQTVGDIHLSSVNETSKKLINAAGEAVETVILGTPHRAKSQELKRIWSSLWDFSVNTKTLEPLPQESSVTIIQCTDEYTEAEAVANTVLKLIKEGYRRREIAIIAGDMDAYRGIIDSTFEKAGIPFFMSERSNLTNAPLISMILSAFSIMLKNWRAADVIAYLKSGLTDIDKSDIDLFEIYVSTWNLNGKRFFDDEWTMNPDGYSKTLSPRGEVILSRANRVKDAITAPLTEFFTKLNAAQNVSELCEATFEFFKSQQLSQKLSARAEEAYNAGDRKGALECAGTHKAFIKVLSDIASSMGDTDMSVEEFASSLKLVFSNTDIGTIPTAADEVILGSASMLRASDIKCAVLIGVCEGQFPSATEDCGFFSDNEKLLLKEFDIELSSNTSRKNAEELLYAYRAMTLPSEKLFLTYNTSSSSGGVKKPSLAITRTLALLPNAKTISYDVADTSDKLMSKRLAFEALRRVSDENAKAALNEIFKNDPYYSPLLKKIKTPINDVNCRVSEKTAKKLFGSDLKLSQSKLEKYIKCHFAYYCQYALDLRETSPASFKYSDSGTFIHDVLEVFVKSTVDENGFKSGMDKAEISKIVLSEADRYISDAFGERIAPPKRLLHLFDRLKRLAVVIALDLYNEISESKFIPTFFEMGIGRGNPPVLPSYELTLNDGSMLKFNGIVDRVDIYKRDGEVFFKVVDYKTGSKDFKLSDVRQGLNIQMLMYLFAICNSKSESFREQLGCDKDATFKPAGVMYISTNVTPQKTNRDISDGELQKKISEKFTREGLILDNDEIILALNENVNKNYLIGTQRTEPTKKDPNPAKAFKGNALTSEEAFYGIEDEITEVLTAIAAEMRSGNASITPLQKEKPCEYCGMKQFCRVNSATFDTNEEENDD